MALDADYLVDRRRLKRRLAWWRILAILGGIALVAVAAGRFAGFSKLDHIARLTIDGVVHLDDDRLEAIEKVRDDSRVKALFVRLNTPGGTVVGGETLHRALREVAARKPVVAVMDDLATSAGYMIAVATDRIFARRGTITGSIGVLYQTTEVTELLDSIGVSTEAIKSGRFKAEPSPFTKMTPAVRTETQRLVDDMQEMFVAMVADGRRIDRARVLELSDGRIFTGRMAVDNGLIDAIGGEREALAWLESDRKISADLPVHDLKFGREADEWFEFVSKLVRKMPFSERLTLDGLVSVWHPQLQ